MEDVAFTLCDCELNKTSSVRQPVELCCLHGDLCRNVIAGSSIRNESADNSQRLFLVDFFIEFCYK